MRITACIEDPEVIEKILTHLDAKGAELEVSRLTPCRLARGSVPLGSVRQRSDDGVNLRPVGWLWATYRSDR